jgi:hypothetical protein
MKKLFCVVLTDLEGFLESPLIYHVKAETQQQAEERALLELVENLACIDTIEEAVESFDPFSFPVEDTDVIEA